MFCKLFKKVVVKNLIKSKNNNFSLNIANIDLIKKIVEKLYIHISNIKIIRSMFHLKIKIKSCSKNLLILPLNKMILAIFKVCLFMIFEIYF